jgi:hypothetical protein
MFKVSSPATDTLPVGYLFNHLFCSNAKGEAAGTYAKIKQSYSRSPPPAC